jgi:hypothetical protein
VPLAPAVTVIHVTLLLAVQAQPAVVVTAIVLAPPVDMNEALVGKIE